MGLPNDLFSRSRAIDVTTGEKTDEVREGRGIISHVGCGHRYTDEGVSAPSAEPKGGEVRDGGLTFWLFSC